MANRRPQNSKKTAYRPGPNPEYVEGMQNLRRSSAASPHRNRARYDRNDYRRDRQNQDY